MTKKWPHYIKDASLLLLAVALLLTAPASTLIRRGEFVLGFLIFAIAIVMGAVGIFIAHHWHKHNIHIHITPLGYITAPALFAFFTFLFLTQGLDFWVPIALVIIPTALGYLMRKIRKR